MKTFWIIILCLCNFSICLKGQELNGENMYHVDTISNEFFKHDKFWRGADGAATIDLKNGKVLWLFSDSFINTQGSGIRSTSRLIRNSVAIQESKNLLESSLTFYYGNNNDQPQSFFKLNSKSWFWTGHGVLVQDRLIVFLQEVVDSNEGLGFQTIGWFTVVVDNPHEDPNQWKLHYFKGPQTSGVIVGSSAVLTDNQSVFTYGIKEPATHEVYLLQIPIDDLLIGDFSKAKWWDNGRFRENISHLPAEPLFIGQTEFSVHFDERLKQYVQIQTYGFGQASIGYRLANQLQGPWSAPVIFFKPVITDKDEFVYTANAHPEFNTNEIFITYNINSFNLSRLLTNESIYFPKIIKLTIDRK